MPFSNSFWYKFNSRLGQNMSLVNRLWKLHPNQFRQIKPQTNSSHDDIENKRNP